MTGVVGELDREIDDGREELASALGMLNAAAAMVVGVLARCIDREWWAVEETNSPEHWVQARCGFDLPRAKRLVRIAREIHAWPALADAFEHGQVCEAAVDVIVRECDPAADRALAQLAPNTTHAQLRIAARAYPKPPPAPEPATTGTDDAESVADTDPEPSPTDVVRVGWTDDGRFVGRLDLNPVTGALFDEALRAARATLFHERTGRDADEADADPTCITWVDALERLSLAALHALDPATAAGLRPSDRYQAIIHVDAEHPERSRINLGPTLTDAQRQEILCDCDLRVVLERDGRPVGKGRRQRVADPVLRSLVEDRDRGCRSCARSGFLHIHHLWHWEHGGPTDPENLCALCTSCHSLVHRGALRIEGDPTRPDGLRFLGRDGRPRPQPRATPPTGPPPAAQPHDGPLRERLQTWWLN